MMRRLRNGHGAACIFVAAVAVSTDRIRPLWRSIRRSVAAVGGQILHFVAAVAVS
jgi:hydroxymethylpyrimidine/phosphomethylpyrimidine kinase